MTTKKILLVTVLLILSEALFFNLKNAAATTRKEIVITPQISEFDYIMRRVAAENQLDWRLLAAIGYHESRFRRDLVSSAGARGVMQVMPGVAKSFGIDKEELACPETNIGAAAKLIKRIEGMMKLPKSTTEEDRMKIILASYNGGIGHVSDARRLATKLGENNNKWDTLEKFIKLKGQPEYIEDESIRYGKFDGSETVQFVEKVMKKYDDYCKNYPI
ncbi:Soluble lytic murein transglycosylase precursor [Mucinivorans hirudinis]|uniref:Soluble lytic murein transglycosylase n=1 Tax=Mucinivorans hirudinis TaxID=1433126 RepID=A0A060RE96_9BACT|nr:Soluble lytic murein transglycosylase precursor [Mucinivorans hirudinis]